MDLRSVLEAEAAAHYSGVAGGALSGGTCLTHGVEMAEMERCTPLHIVSVFWT